jgi:hypothetical protein
MPFFPRLASWAVTALMEATEGAGGAAAQGDGALPAGAAEGAPAVAATETTASDGTRYPHQVTSSPLDQYPSGSATFL